MNKLNPWVLIKYYSNYDNNHNYYSKNNGLKLNNQKKLKFL